MNNELPTDERARMPDHALGQADLAQLRHALRTPLNHILGYTEILLEDAGNLSDTATKSLRSIHAGANQILQLIERRLTSEASGATTETLAKLREGLGAALRPITETIQSLRPMAAGPLSDDLDKIEGAARVLLAFAKGESLEAEPAPALHPQMTTVPDCQQGRLLVIDDNENNREMLRRRLEREGYSVTTASGGREGLQTLAEHPFDLVLLDILMPELDGFQVLSQLKANPEWASIPVIVISALHEIRGVVRCIEMGAEDFVPKPFDPVLLRARIGAVLKRRRVEEERTELAEHLRLLLESTGEGIFEIDSAFACTFANSAAVELLGHSREVLMASNIHELIHHNRPDGTPYPVAACPVRQVLLTGEARRVADEVFFRADGSSFPVEYSAHPIVKNGLVRGAVVIFSDISQRRRTEERLRQAAKLESLGVLAGGIAHDFNNLLTGIMGNVSLVLDKIAPGDSNRELLQSAIQASEQAAELTKQMLAFAGKGRFIVSPVNLSQMVESMHDLLSASVPEKVAVRFMLLPDLPRIEADAEQIRQLILNLVINAGEAIEGQPQGTVLIETGVRLVDGSTDTEVAAEKLAPGTYAYLAVHDNGHGMDQATCSKIFDPFFTTKFLGRGLGLPACLGIVRSHNGALHVESELGRGSRFEAYFPVMEAQARQPERIARPFEPLSSTVLVVDDEEIVRRIAKVVLERAGFGVILAKDGAQAVHIFKENLDRIGAVLMDLTMPVMGGEEATRQLLSIAPQVPVLISSGYDESQVAPKFLGQGITGFVQKPYNAAKLTQAVTAAVKIHRAGAH